MISYDLNTTAEIVGGTLKGQGEAVYSGLTIDSRNVGKNVLFVPIIGERLNGHQFVSQALAKGALASLWQQDQPDCPADGNIITVKDTAAALHDMSRYYRAHLQTKIIGITGSIGKTSAKDLIAAVLSSRYQVSKTSGNYNNLLGVPQTLAAIDAKDDFAVCEMGLQHQGDMAQLVDAAMPDIAVITAIAPCHIEYFHDLAGIAAEKGQIISRLAAGQPCYYNHQAYGLKEMLPRINPEAELISYGFDRTSCIWADNISSCSQGQSFTTNLFENYCFVLPLLGRHQILNALPAIAIGKQFNMTASQIQHGFDSIVLTPHRLQVRKAGPGLLIDDAYNSNPEAVIGSLNVLKEYPTDRRRIAVLGDMLELGKRQNAMHAGLADEFDFSCLDGIYLYGPCMKYLADALVSRQISCSYFSDIGQLSAALIKEIDKGSVVLLKASNGMHFIDMITTLEAHYE